MIFKLFLARAAASSLDLAASCTNEDFPMHQAHIKVVAKGLNLGQAVAFRPINEHVKGLIEKNVGDKPSVTGKGFLASGKSSDLPFLASRIPVDPRLSKKGGGHRGIDKVTIAKHEKDYKKHQQDFPDDSIKELSVLKANKKITIMCEKLGKHIKFEGGSDELKFNVVKDLAENPHFGAEEPKGKEAPKNSMCQYRKVSRTEGIKVCGSDTTEKSFNQYFVRYDPDQKGDTFTRTVFLRNNDATHSVFRYDADKECVVAEKMATDMQFGDLQVFTYAFANKNNELVYNELIADYDILMFGWNKKENPKAYNEAIQKWVHGWKDHGVQVPEGSTEADVRTMTKNVKKLLSKGSNSAISLPRVVGLEESTVNELVEAFRCVESDDRAPLCRMIRHNHETANYASPNGWEYGEMHPFVYRKKDGNITCCNVRGEVFKKDGGAKDGYEQTLKGCGLDVDVITFFPHLFWTETKKLTNEVPDWKGNIMTRDYNVQGTDSLDASAFATDMMQKILRDFHHGNKQSTSKAQPVKAHESTEAHFIGTKHQSGGILGAFRSQISSEGPEYSGREIN